MTLCFLAISREVNLLILAGSRMRTVILDGGVLDVMTASRAVPPM